MWGGRIWEEKGSSFHILLFRGIFRCFIFVKGGRGAREREKGREDGEGGREGWSKKREGEG